MEQKIEQEVDQLLHDAEGAFGGHEMARQMNDPENSRALLVKAATLFAEALKIDPKAEASAWRQ